MKNPFAGDPDRSEIWEVLVRRDFEAFVAADWSIIADDFVEEEFQGIDGAKLPNPDKWTLRFPDLAGYRDEWIGQAAEFKPVEFKGVSKLDFLYQAGVLTDIEIKGSRAFAHKKFDGTAETTDGKPIRFLWQSLFSLKRVNGHWKVTGFVGFLPNPLGS
jgi:hypothetical protein